jgi:hypothetical protein
MEFKTFEIVVNNLGIITHKEFEKNLNNNFLTFGYYNGRSVTISEDVCEKLDEIGLDVDVVHKQIYREIKNYCSLDLTYSNVGIYINDFENVVKLDIFLYQTIEQDNLELINLYVSILPQDYITKIANRIKLTQKRLREKLLLEFSKSGL